MRTGAMPVIAIGMQVAIAFAGGSHNSLGVIRPDAKQVCCSYKSVLMRD